MRKFFRISYYAVWNVVWLEKKNRIKQIINATELLMFIFVTSSFLYKRIHKYIFLVQIENGKKGENLKLTKTNFVLQHNLHTVYFKRQRRKNKDRVNWVEDRKINQNERRKMEKWNGFAKDLPEMMVTKKKKRSPDDGIRLKAETIH